MTFSVLKRHTNVIEIKDENGIKASKTLVYYELSSHYYVGNEPFPRRERTVPTVETDCFHEGNGLFPRRERCVTIKGTTVKLLPKRRLIGII